MRGLRGLGRAVLMTAAALAAQAQTQAEKPKIALYIAGDYLNMGDDYDYVYEGRSKDHAFSVRYIQD